MQISNLKPAGTNPGLPTGAAEVEQMKRVEAAASHHDTFSSFKGATLRPTRSQFMAWVLGGTAALGVGTGVAHADVVSYSGAATTFTAPSTGLYQITAIGGGGGDDGNPDSEGVGGDGAVVTGTFSLVSGEELDILVGGQGGSAADEPGAGGGATYVATPYVLLLTAGGGGGGSVESAGNPAQGISATGGTGGMGGAGNTSSQVEGGSGGGGGGGYLTSGTTGAPGGYLGGGDPGGGFGGSYTSGGTGGAGGGGARADVGGGGGGGGYSGGDGGSGAVNLGDPGDGGTSYDSGLDSSFALDTILENGSVTITAVPEPTSLGLLSLAGLAMLRRRRP
jgi:hypothetical protein